MKTCYPVILLSLILFQFSTLHAQELKPTEDKVLVNVKAVNAGDNSPKEGQKVTFVVKATQKEYTKKTGKDGTFQILLPKGNVYSIYYETFGGEKKFRDQELPDQPGMMTMQLTVTTSQSPNKITLRNVHFNTNESTLRESSYPALNNLVKALKSKPDIKVLIAGHTDNRGDKVSNKKLSQNRAESVVNYLIEKGIDPSRLRAKGYGESQPIATNETAAGRQENRRTEMRVLQK